MPALIQHIDAIARKKGRDVLYLEFHPQPSKQWREYRFEDDPVRAGVLSWLDAHDVPYDAALPGYYVLRDCLQHPDGTMRHAGVRFHAMPLDYAMENAAHDAPGLCERWAEDF